MLRNRGFTQIFLQALKGRHKLAWGIALRNVEMQHSCKKWNVDNTDATQSRIYTDFFASPERAQQISVGHRPTEC